MSTRPLTFWRVRATLMLTTAPSLKRSKQKYDFSAFDCHRFLRLPLPCLDCHRFLRLPLPCLDCHRFLRLPLQAPPSFDTLHEHLSAAVTAVSFSRLHPSYFVASRRCAWTSVRCMDVCAGYGRRLCGACIRGRTERGGVGGHAVHTATCTATCMHCHMHALHRTCSAAAL